MKLEPVFLVAPDPEPRPNRRAFLGIAATSLAVGLGGGWLLHRIAAERPPADPIVKWARDCAADSARTAELLRYHQGFLYALNQAPDDELLWTAFGRLVDQLEATAPDPANSEAAASLRQSLRALGSTQTSTSSWDQRLRALERR